MTDVTELQALRERERIVETITTLFVATDERDWAAVRACFAPVVLFDMTSLAGGAPETRSPAEIAAGWERGLAPVQAVHHQVGNFRVRVAGPDAEASCYGIAYHYIPKPSGRSTRVFVGAYDFGLRHAESRWVIHTFRFRLAFIDGNRDLESSE